jgi:hypothetical protein
MPVPLFDTRTPLAPLRAEIDAKLAEVLDRSSFILGPEVEAFEAEFAAYLGARHAVGVANGTDAITLALRALGVGPGDEVIVPSFTFYASAEAIRTPGRARFCDVDPDTFCVTAETVRAALTPRTKAVIAVHLFGNVAPVAEIAALGVPVSRTRHRRPARWAPPGRPGASARSRPSPSSPRRTSVLRRRRRRHDQRPRAGRARARAALPRLARQEHVHRGRLQLAPRRAAGRDPARAAAPPRLLVDGRRAAGAAYERAGLGELVRLPRARDGASPRGTSTWCATPPPMRWRRR